MTFVNRYLSRNPIGDLNSDFSDMQGHWADGQVLAAASDKDQNSWTYGEAEDLTAFVMPESADDAEDYIKALYDQSGKLSGKAIRKGTDEIAERMKKDIPGKS